MNVEFYVKMREEIIFIIESAKFLSISCYIWSKKCLTSSYLGVQTHFYHINDAKKYQLVLALREFPHPHTAQNIMDLLIFILKEYKIDIQNVFKVITDRVSNMIKACDLLENEINNSDFDADDFNDINLRK